MKDGGPAFPVQSQLGPNAAGTWFQMADGGAGMSLRDYFAAAALSKVTVFVDGDDPKGYGKVRPAMAAEAYRIADAMLAEREKQS